MLVFMDYLTVHYALLMIFQMAPNCLRNNSKHMMFPDYTTLLL